MKTLVALAENSPATSTISIARELTKMHEEFVSGTTHEVLAYFKEHEEHQKGEFVVMVNPSSRS